MDIKNSGENKNNSKGDIGNNGKPSLGIKVFLSVFILFIFSIAAALVIKFDRTNPVLPILPTPTEQPLTGNINGIKKFSSDQDFKNYLEESSSLASSYGGGIGISTMTKGALPPMPGAVSQNATDATGTGTAPNRVSETNVQVIGIDEPDIVKTDGKEIYFSGTQQFYPLMQGVVSESPVPGNPGMSSDSQKMIAPYPYPAPQAETKIVKAFPPADLSQEGKIDKQGDLLIDNNILVVFHTQGYYDGYGANQEIAAYDISNPKSPTSKWSITVKKNTSIVTSRMNNGKIYLIAKNNIDQNRLCPIQPFSMGDTDISIPCSEIYHPIIPVPSDTTFTASVINPIDGKIEKTVSFIGSSSTSIIYMSENAIYATYAYNASIIKFLSGFINENSNFFPASLVKQINKLNDYDISESSKMTEFSVIMEKYTSSLDSDAQLKFQNEMANRMNDYYKAHGRELEKTGIVKIDTDNFRIAATGEVSGHLLNNFSMDEYEGNLRVASTIGSTWGIFSGIGTGQSVSDVTILDKNLNEIGSVKDLGKTEQIYSVRFIEDKGYVVTFRQTDPFYVLDLADPKNPSLAGELKIPGYSSYLHPLDATHILGIGMENNKVKISIFDVSDKNNPVEIDKYNLDEYWTDVSNNYHAFLLDTKHNIFFLPGSKGGYVFSYYITTSGEFCTAGCIPSHLNLRKAVSQNSVKRAIYLNDYLYIIGDDKITVLNELDWQKVNELDLGKAIQ